MAQGGAQDCFLGGREFSVNRPQALRAAGDSLALEDFAGCTGNRPMRGL
ncbi:MAG: hypothetical protein M0Z44_04695 [Gammaproteobacteria bacterium]|nr:hypothetical protein [Gammaproteobacteria bacterium]